MRQHTSLSPPVDPPLDALLDDPHRRVVLRILSERDEPVSVDELAVALDGPRASGQHDQSGACDARVALHHNHLPRLDAAGVVEYDPGEKTVRPVGVEDVAAVDVDGAWRSRS